MDSVILSFIFIALKNSFLYKAFIKIYNAVSKSWCNSVIMSFFRQDNIKENEKHSIFYKIIYSPVKILDFFNRKVGKSIKNIIDSSVIIGICDDFLNNALALNTRFLGVLILSALCAREVVLLKSSVILLILSIIGIALVLTDYNITDFISESKIVRFCLKAVGFSDISWDFYNSNSTKKITPYILAIILGVVSGVLSIKSVVFFILPFVAFTGFITVLKYPLVGVFCAVFSAPFVPTMILAGLILFTAFSFVVQSVITQDFKWKIDGVGTGLIAFLIFMLISSIFSFSRNTSILVWGMYLIFIGFYFIIINAVETKEQLYSLIKIFVIAGVLVSIYGVCQYIFGWNTSNAWIDEEMFENATMRAYSTMENPNVLGEYLLLVIPLSAMLMIKTSFKKLDKYFWAGTFLIATLCMVFTQSRGCWIGLFVAATIFVTFYNGKLWGFLPLLLVALPFIIPQTMIDRFMSVGNLEDSSTSYRVFIWLGTLTMLKDFWLGGIGMGEGAFRSVYPFYSYNAIIAPHSHNLYLQLLVEGGVAALLIFIVTILVFVKKTSQIYLNNGKKAYDSILSLAIVSGVAGFMVQSMFDYTFYNFRMMAMFFMFLAFAVTLSYLQGGTKNENN